VGGGNRSRVNPCTSVNNGLFERACCGGCDLYMYVPMMICLPPPPPQGTPPHTAADMDHSTHSTQPHSQHCGHTALPPGQKTNPRRGAVTGDACGGAARCGCGGERTGLRVRVNLGGGGGSFTRVL